MTARDRTLRKAWLVLPLLVALAFPLATSNAYYISIIVQALIIAVAVYGLNVLVGYTGQLSLAHAGFFGTSAYIVGYMTTEYGASFWVAMPIAVSASAILGYLLGMVALRTKGNYFAIFTLAVGVMVTVIIDRWESVTGGTDGMIGVPPPDPIGPLSFDSLTGQYYLALFFLVATIIAVWNVSRSLVGRTLLAIRNDDRLAEAIGINVGRTKRLSFAISTTLAGLSGALYAPFLGYLGPSISGLAMMFNMLLYLMIGGAASLSGPLIGTVLLIIVSQGLLAFEGMQLVILGPLLILSITFFPRGIAGLIGDFGKRIRQRRADVPSTVFVEPRVIRATRHEDAHVASSTEPGD